jgi:hypothetical protein
MNLMPEVTEPASKKGTKVVMQKDKVKLAYLMSNADPVRQAQASPPRKKISHPPHNDIVQKKKR